MPVAFDAEAHSGASAATSIPDFTLTIGGGVTNGAVLVSLSFDDGIPTDVSIIITVGGNSASIISGTSFTEGTFIKSVMFGLATGSDTGAQTVSISWTGTSSANAAALSFSGADQTTPFQNGTGTSYGFGITAASITITSATNNMTADNVTDRTGTAHTGHNQTVRYNVIANSQSTSGQTAVGAASNIHSCTIPGGRGAHSGADILAAAAAAGRIMSSLANSGGLAARGGIAGEGGGLAG